MKNYVTFLLLCMLVLFAGCQGSDVYRGKWKATDASGNKYEIIFGAKEFFVADSTLKKESYTYTQNSVEIKNAVKTYGIRVGDGRTYLIKFPLVGDESKAVIVLENNEVMFTMDRNAYIKYEDLYGLTK